MTWRVDLGNGYWYDNTPDYYGINKEGIEKVEKSRNCRYVCEWNVMENGKVFTEKPMVIFWNDTPHPQGSNWMALFRHTTSGDWYVRNGITASQLPIECMVSDSKQVLFSKSRHDFRQSNDRSVSVDGGRDYTRVLGKVRNERVWMVPYQGELKLIPDAMAQLMLDKTK